VAIWFVGYGIWRKNRMVYCYDMRCKYCNDKYKCTNKKVELYYHGINTKYQGYQDYLKCKSFEESELYKNTIEWLQKIDNKKVEDK
jgi:hypothetical protein